MSSCVLAPVLTAALLAALATGDCHADPLTFSTSTGLPRITTVDGQALAWRHLGVRVEMPLATLSIKLPFCLDAAPEATLPTHVAPGGAPQRCTGLASTGLGSSALSQVSRQWKLVAPLPTPWSGGPSLALSAFGWHAMEHQASPDRGAAVELGLTQSLGDFELSASHTEPVGSNRAVDGWRTGYVGLSWAPSARHEVEMFYDHSRALSDGERDRQATLRYTYRNSGPAHWRLFATRHLDDSGEPWDAGVSVDWAF